jgi:hypothetical protein
LVLEVTFSSLVADGAVQGVVDLRIKCAGSDGE